MLYARFRNRRSPVVFRLRRGAEVESGSVQRQLDLILEKLEIGVIDVFHPVPQGFGHCADPTGLFAAGFIEQVVQAIGVFSQVVEFLTGAMEVEIGAGADPWVVGVLHCRKGEAAHRLVAELRLAVRPAVPDIEEVAVIDGAHRQVLPGVGSLMKGEHPVV